MVYTLLLLSQEGIQLFLSLDMHMAKYNYIPCAKEEKERLKFFQHALCISSSFPFPLCLLILSLEE